MIIKLLATTLLLTTAAHAAPLSLSMFEKDKNTDTQIILPTETWEASESGEHEFFGLRVLSSKRYDDTQRYVESQTYIPEYNRKSLSAHAFMLEYMMQNADDSKALTEVAPKVSNAEFCLYFAYDDSIRFAQDQVIRMLSSDDAASIRMKASIAYVSKAITDLETPEHEVKMKILQCGKLVDGY